MSWITNAFNRKVVENTGASGDFFIPMGLMSSVNWSNNEYLKNYLEIPEVAAVINMKARMFSNMKISIVNNKGEEVNNMDPMVRALRNPNYYQSQKEFLMQTKIFQEIYGNEYIYFLQPAGFSNNIKGIFTLPPNCVTIDTSMVKSPYFINESMPEGVKYNVTWDGKMISSIKKEDIIHINNTNTSPRPDDWLDGKSPMTSLSMPIQNIRASYEARNVLIENRGALGILSNGASDAMGSTVPMNSTEKAKLQKDLKGYGLSKADKQFIITNLNLKWQQMTIDADKLQLFDENRESMIRICDVYGVKFELFGNQKGVTFDNQKLAEKATYQDTIIPEAMEWIDALNRRFETKNKSWSIKGAFDHLPVFADDMLTQATLLNQVVTALSKSLADGAITIEQYKSELAKFKIGE